MMDKYYCWNCGSEVRTAGSICKCGIDLWAYPHPVPVEHDPDLAGRYHVTDAVASQFRFAMHAGKPNLLP